MKIKYILLIAVLLTGSFRGAKAQVSKTIYVDKAGTLISNLTEEEAQSVTHLTITGKINAVDFKNLRNDFNKLESLDISNADIRTYTGKGGTFPDEKFYIYQPNTIPTYAFCFALNGDTLGKSSLKEVIISEKIRTIEEYAFKGCKNLFSLVINKKTPPNLQNNALDHHTTAVFIPLGSRDEYRYKKNFEDFVLIEGKPVKASIKIEAGGSLKEEVQSAGLTPKEINYLTIEGKLDSEDLKLISDYMSGLVSVDISNTTAVMFPDFTFAQKKNLLRIALPKNLKVIGQRVFSGCEHLSGDLYLPESMTTINYGAFMGCKNLRQVIATGSSLTSLGDNLFGDEKGKLINK
ncbi:leucine-rich repeat domain-containing protein [Bacteroides sp. OttesenSCG-928-J23]|nr:leucine-rich repeat domain-containing protein [Bacteroides sp. OttesenSCG-928-M17]MDL2247947.1 leucine-rich repeat domain-containing protein [Bacteroides sp. OttesenSCG-928-J23]